ncbi:MAG: hypothetical protein AAFO94_11010, partial [Bacteroidota bacterium]
YQKICSFFNILKMVMKIKILYLVFAGILGLVLLPSACTFDKLEEPIVNLDCSSENPTYNTLVKPILDQSCAIAGCHVAGGGGIGNYSSYDDMQNYLNDNEFKKFVIDLKNDPDRGMPPNWPTNPGPKDLTPDQFAIIQCWVEAGYPEQ